MIAILRIARLVSDMCVFNSECCVMDGGGDDSKALPISVTRYYSMVIGLAALQRGGND
jgi:hypothetical protein